LKNLLRKSLFYALAMAHLAAAAGYAGIEHHCLHQHQAPAAETACCCADQPEAAASSCPAPISAKVLSSSASAASSADAESPCSAAEMAPALPAAEESTPVLVQPDCCELVSLYHRVEESAPPAFTALLQAPAAPIALLPPNRSSAAGIVCCTATVDTAKRLNLPLII